ncbi:MAG: response regulator [Deltaproteobacteria bacterium]
MTRLLLIDDDPAQLRALARTLSVRRSDLSVVTATDGSQALELLASTPVDLVLTDLQMPGMNGFELLAWIVSNAPHVPVFTMTGFPDQASVERLDRLGAIECFTKPLDIPNVLERLLDAVARGVRGHVRNISLASFLQIIEMERKTCTLTVQSGERRGRLHIRDGALIHAKLGDEIGEAAALEIIGWNAPAITISSLFASGEQTIDTSMSFLIMESMRIRDESGLELPEARDFTAPFPHGADAVAEITADTGKILWSEGDCDGLDELAQLVIALYRAECSAVATMELGDAVEEIVLTRREQVVLMRCINNDRIVMSVFSPTNTTIGMQRLELSRVTAALGAQN